MGIFKNFREARDARGTTRRQRARAVRQEISNRLVTSPLCSDFENVFAQLQPIVNEMIKVQPFGVGRNGGPLSLRQTPELATLLSIPNDQMSWIDFANLMFTTWLTEDELDIHVHYSGRRVSGYTILPPNSRTWLGDGDYYYQVSVDGQIVDVSRDDVMELRYSRSPKNAMRGVSPATAVRAWAQTEDVLAQYERAYIENGAIPASITFIRASSQAKFEHIRQELESNLTGASNHGKTIYVWRQFNNDDGSEKDQVEVKTIQGNNSTLAIKELTDIINDHLNKAFGVSNFILGDDASAKYDNAELSDYQFIKRRIYPNLLKFWNQFQFELDRVTGGLGYGIQFKLELPDLTERIKTRAEINKTRVETLKTLIESGASAIEAVRALDLGDSWLGVARGIYSRSLVANDEKQKAIQKLAHNNSRTQYNTHPSHPSLDNMVHVSASDDLPDMTKEEMQVYRALLDMAERIYANTPDINEQETIDQIVEALEKNAKNGASGGASAMAGLIQNADIVSEIKSELSSMDITGTLRDRLKSRTGELVMNYGEQTRNVLESALNSSQGKSAGEIQKELAELFDKDTKWRARRIARTETVYAYKSGRLDEDIKIRDRYGLNVKLQWHARHDSKTCSVCAAMDGKMVELGEAFEHDFTLPAGTKLINCTTLDEEQSISWDVNRWNDEGRIPQPHPDCRCYVDEIVEES